MRGPTIGTIQNVHMRYEMGIFSFTIVYVVNV